MSDQEATAVPVNGRYQIEDALLPTLLDEAKQIRDCLYDDAASGSVAQARVTHLGHVLRLIEKRIGEVAKGSAAVIAKAVDDLDKVSRRLSRAGGMAMAAAMTDLVEVIGEAGCDLDTVINDLQELAPDAT